MRPVFCSATLPVLMFAVGCCLQLSHASDSLLQTFNDPTITSGDVFGDPVAIQGDYVLIGAIGRDKSSLNIGQAHLYDTSDGSLLHTYDDPTPTSFDFFGRSVAIDSDYVLIGANGDDTTGMNAGQAHLFDAVTGDLLQTFDNPTTTGGRGFGVSLAINGDLILIGAPSGVGKDVGQAHLFDAATGNLLRTFNDPTPTAGHNFGISVSIDGTTALIGASSDGIDGADDVGQAHLFDATTGNLLQTFYDPTPTDGDGFGISVAIDGGNVLIGAPGDDSEGPNIGQAHQFDATTGSLLWTFNDPTPTDGDEFGGSIAIDGGNIAIGASGDRTNSSDDGNRFGVGQAHVFNATTGDLIRTLNDPTITSGDLFGHSIAIDGSLVLIGAPADDTNGPNIGQAHLFDITIPEPKTSVLLLSVMAPILVCRAAISRTSTG